MKKNTRNEILKVTTLFFSAILSAILFAGYMIYYYGPSGIYLAENVILSPSMMDKINYKDSHPKTGQLVRFIFNSIEFSYFDKVSGNLRQFPVDEATYEEFYRLIQSAKGSESIMGEIQEQFDRGLASNLSIMMQTEERVSPPTTKVFQVIQFVESDYFRVQLLQGDNNPNPWVYFYQPGVYQKIMQLFTKV